MSPRRLLLLTAVVFALFAFIVFFERKLPSTGDRQAKGDLHWDMPEDRVISIKLERPGSVVELARDGETWRLTQPFPYPADSFAASDLARQLAQLKRVGGESADAKPEDYGLTKPVATATIAWKDPGDTAKPSTRALEFGIDIPGTDVAAARVVGETKVLFVPSSLSAEVRKGAADFQSKEVFGGSSADVARIDLDRGRGQLLLVQRDGIWWMEQPLKDLANADAASSLAGDLTSMRVVDFLASELASLPTWGLAPPLYRVTLSDAKGKATAVEFGATRSDGNSVYARREGQMFTVSSSSVEELSKEAEGFREPGLVKFDRARASGVEGTFGDRHLSFARAKDGGWSAGGKTVLAGNAEDVMNAILDLKSRSFADEADARALAARTPSGTVKVALSGGEPWEIKLYGDPGEPAATVSRRPGAFRMSSDPAGSLLAVFQKALSSPTPTVAPKPKS